MFCLQITVNKCPRFLCLGKSRLCSFLLISNILVIPNIAVDVVAPVCEPLNVSNRKSLQTNTVHLRMHVSRVTRHLVILIQHLITCYTIVITVGFKLSGLCC